MRQTVIGLFNKSSDAQDAVQRLLSSGFTNDNVDISLSTASNTSGSTNFNLDNDRDEHESGISRFFKNLFGDDDDDANRYSTASRGKSIVTVHALSDDEAERASDILDEAGAVDVDENADDYSYGTTGAAPEGAFNETTGTGITSDTTSGLTQDYTSTGRSSMGTGSLDTIGTGTGITAGTGMSADMTTGTGRTSDSDLTDKKIPIVEENLEVGKRTVQTGGVRLRSRVVEKPVEEELRLRTERVYVQRNPVDRPASEADFTSFREGEVEVTESAEVPVVSKEARVVEEVSLGKDVDERTETIRDTVRKTEVDVEDLENKSGRSGSDTTWRDNS